jgi:TonB-linked SusC/RagA family outer membrane protein
MQVRGSLMAGLFLGLVLAAFAAAPVAAQNATVHGVVTDSATGRNLEGALVSIAGTQIRTQVKTDGSYAFAQVTPGVITIRVQMIGYNPAERQVTVPATGDVTADIALGAKAIELQELVSVGYGEAARSDLTSAVGSLDGQDLTKTVAGLDAGLQGKVAGVQVLQNAGNPGNGISIRVRGSASISAGNQPLYVIDGVPMISEDYSQLGLGGQGVSGVTGISQNEVERIDVLKDAAATAIYGSRGSNGVVMITTKRGKAGKAQVTLDAYTGPQWASRRLELMNSTEYLTFFNEGAENDGYGPNYIGTLGIDDQINTDWQDAALREAPVGSVQLAVAGGDDRLRYRVSGDMFDQQGIVIGSSYRRLAGRINLDFNTSEKLSFRSSLAVSGETNNRIENDNSITGIITDVVGNAPIFPVKNPDGTFFGPDDNLPSSTLGIGMQYPNSVALGTLNTADARTTRIIGNLEGNYRFGSGFGFTSRLGVDLLDVKETQFESPDVGGTYAASAGGIAKRSYSAGNRYVFDNFVSWDRTWGGRHHALTATAGNSIEYTNNDLNFIRGEGLADPKLTEVRNTTTPTVFDGTESRSTLVSFFGRANYSLNDTYLLSGSLRTDGSSRFGPDSRWGVFPAVSAAWVMTRESFLKGSSWLDELKLRGSWGLTGNQPSDLYPYQGTAGTSNYGGTPGLANSSLSNPDLKWESTEQIDIGVDFTMFKGRVFLTADWYKKDTKDLLLERPISNTSGFTSVFANVGDMTNKGFEIGLETVNIQAKDPRGFNWRTGLNLSINRNEVTKLANNEPFSSYVNRVQVGHELGEFYMLKFLGVDPATGDAIFKDVDGDGVITSNDQTFVGSPHPDYSGGLTNEFTWKGVDLSFLMTFSQGNKIYNDMRTYSASGGYYFDNQFKDQLKRWQKPGDQTDVPRASYDGVSGAYGDPTSRFLENGSYLRMQEITLGYQFPENWAASVLTRSLRLYAGVRNAFIITDYSGYDPDVNSGGSSTNVSLANDFYAYPQARTVILGIQAGW